MQFQIMFESDGHWRFVVINCSLIISQCLEICNRSEQIKYTLVLGRGSPFTFFYRELLLCKIDVSAHLSPICAG